MQTTITGAPAKALPGMLADTSYKRSISRAVGQDDGLLPGVFVYEGKTDKKVYAAGTAGAVYAGVTLRDLSLSGFVVATADNNPATSGQPKLDLKYEKTRAASVLERGAVWVLVATGSTIGNRDAVSCVTTGAEAGYATTGIIGAAVVPNAQARGNVETLADGRRIIEVELGAGAL